MRDIKTYKLMELLKGLDNTPERAFIRNQIMRRVKHLVSAFLEDLIKIEDSTYYGELDYDVQEELRDKYEKLLEGLTFQYE